MAGNVLLVLATLCCLGAIVSYLAYRRNPAERLLSIARSCYVLTVTFFLAAAGFFLYLILTHQFQYTYIWSYSSRALPLPLLISTFYAGQEGSFMLWTMYTVIIGIFLLRHSRHHGYEPEVMTVYSLIPLTLFILLMVKNPFKLVWESFPGQVNAGFTPPDGRGLNPLLQNYWMVIHPQVLFSGFACMAVPYAYALAALIKRDYRNWFRPATPWLVLGSLVLGTGIMMGGFWAYETLGWGGYWGWDPVENSSLVPWICSVAGLHMVLTLRRTGRFVRTTLVLGILCFLMVVYSTFLTRSGVLGETSVHSFVDPGMLVYWLLVGMIVVFTGLAAWFLVSRWRDIPRSQATKSIYSREFALFLGAVTLLAIALLVVIGTSAPLITDLLYGKKSAMDTSFYSGFALPLGLVISLLSGLAQVLWWSRSRLREVGQFLVPSLIVALVGTGALALAIPMPLRVALFIGGAIFSLAINLQVGWRIVKGNPKYAAGAMAHVGLAVMFLGFVASSEFDEKHTLSLEQGVPQTVMGYSLTYQGYKPVGNDKYAFAVHVAKGDDQFTIAPVMFYSSYNDGLMRTPDIRNLYAKDFYLAPLSLEQPSDAAGAGTQKIHLGLGEKKQMGGLVIRFSDFDFPANQREAMLEGKDVEIGVRLEVAESASKRSVIVPKKVMHQGAMADVPAVLHDQYEFTIDAMHPDPETRENSSVDILVKDRNAAAAAARTNAGKRDILVVEASMKPFINLVWSGLIILLAGLVVTIVRRSQEASVVRASLGGPLPVDVGRNDVGGSSPHQPGEDKEEELDVLEQGVEGGSRRE